MRVPIFAIGLTLAAALTAAAQAPARFVRPELLVDAAWLAANLTATNVRIVDMRPRGYAEGHIPGAVWLDNNAIRMPDRPPTFLPTRRSSRR